MAETTNRILLCQVENIGSVAEVKLVTFTAGGAPEIGIIDENGILPLNRVAPDLSSDMITLIAAWPDIAPSICQIITNHKERLPPEGVRLLAPVPRPKKILAIGLNYGDHVAEMKLERPKTPVWFCKLPTSAAGPYDSIPLPRGTAQTDYEAELVAVIGRGGRYIDKKDAPAAVFGFCCGNDVSVRDWQMATSQWTLGKCGDGHAPFGPWITTMDAVPDPHVLEIRSFVNGELRQSSNTRHLIFDVWDQIAYVSQVMTLEPGDLIFTGTPGGVGLGMKPPQFLKEADIVRIEIDGLGHIKASCHAD